MGCLVVEFARVGGNVSAGTERIGGNVSAGAVRSGGGLSASATRVGGMSAWFGLVCGPALIPPFLRVADGGYVLTVDDGYIILNEPYNNIGEQEND